MSDLIDRKAAIDTARKYLLACCVEDGDYHADGIEYELNRLPSAQEWIPVSERLPENYGTYICTCFDGCANRVTFVKWQNKLQQWILNGSRSYWKVIAWMLLPEPYKGDKSND